MVELGERTSKRWPSGSSRPSTTARRGAHPQVRHAVRRTGRGRRSGSARRRRGGLMAIGSRSRFVSTSPSMVFSIARRCRTLAGVAHRDGYPPCRSSTVRPLPCRDEARDRSIGRRTGRDHRSRSPGHSTAPSRFAVTGRDPEATTTDIEARLSVDGDGTSSTGGCASACRCASGASRALRAPGPPRRGLDLEAFKQRPGVGATD